MTNCNAVYATLLWCVMQFSSSCVSADDLTPLQSQHNHSHANCNSPCQTIHDYQHDRTPLGFSRTRALSNTRQGAAAMPWRHNFEQVLTRDGAQRVLFDEWGNRLVFDPVTGGDFHARQANSGTLETTDTGHTWTNKHGVRYHFFGSYPTQITYPDGQQLTLRYRGAQLLSISDDNRNRIAFHYQQNQLSRVALPDGSMVDYPRKSCDEFQCDTQANPIAGFNATASSALIDWVDARPASCQSYFVDYSGTERGTQIETGLQTLAPYSNMTATVRSFPIVDFINGHELIVVRSRDLGSPSFNAPAQPNALLHRLLRDGRDIQHFFLDPLAAQGFISSSELGNSTRIESHPDQTLTLQLLIRQHMASPSHWRQIEQARRQLHATHGIRLKVVIIP